MTINVEKNRVSLLENLNLRRITEKDADLLCQLVRQCPPLDIHTPYTYWVICKYFAHYSFVLELDGLPVGYIMSIRTNDCVFLWQIGLLPSVRGSGYAQLLINQVVHCAGLLSLPVQLTIDELNVASYKAIQKYCQQHSLVIREIGLVALDSCKPERLYELQYLQ